MTGQAGPQFGSNDPARGGAGAPTCPRHPGVVTFVSCGRCGRPACPDCVVQAPVGVRCRDCVSEESKGRRVARTVFGGEYRGDDAQPVLTYALVAINVLLWLGQLVSDEVTNRLAFMPAIALAEPWRFLTACFVHLPTNPTHLAFNMLALWSVGRVLEPMLGRVRYLAVYLLAGLAGSVAMVLSAALFAAAGSFDPWFGGSLGASGAVFGLFGAYFVAMRRLGGDLSWIAGLLGMNLVITFLFPGIAWEAHVGGLVFGTAAMAALSATARPERLRLQWPVLGGLLALLILLTGLSYAMSPLPFLTP